MCPVFMADTGLTLLRNQDDQAIEDTYLPNMLSNSLDQL